MKRKIFIVLLFLSLVCQSKAQEKIRIPAGNQGLSFKEFVLVTQNLLKIKFYYKNEWVEGLRLGDYPGDLTLPELLDTLFSGISIYYYIDKSGNVVLTKDFAVKFPDKTVSGKPDYISASGSPVSEERQQVGNIAVKIGNPAEKNKPGNVSISGYIKNIDSKEPLSGATVLINKSGTGTISNQFGFYTLSLTRGMHTLRFSFLGMREKTIDIDLYGTGELNVEMNSILIPIKEAVVYAQKNILLQRFEVGVEKVNMTSFRLSPNSLGESDILKNIILMPGVQSVGEGSAGFNVRGGSADQNLILLYGAPVYNSSHFFGFFSAINSDIIKDVTLYKGGIPGRYGGRISSILDIGTKDGNRKEFAGSAGISPITTHILIEGPLIRDTLTYILTARTTYSNWIFRLLNRPAFQNSIASFHDINGKITYDLNDNNKINISAYNSHDLFRLHSDTAYSYSNSIFALNWRHFFTNRLFSSLLINNSSHKFEVSSQSVAAEAFALSHKINSTGIKADFNWFLSRNELNFGLDLTRYSVSPGSYLPKSDSSNVIPHTLEKERAFEGALYIDDKLTLTNFLSISIGLRFSTFYSLGPRTIMSYDPGFSKSLATVIDTLHYGKGKIIGKYSGPEFRASLNFRISDRNSFKINYNRTRQYLHLLSNSASISPTDMWKLSDYHLSPQIGDQVAAGFYEILFNNSIEASAELYYKWMRNMVDFKGGTNFLMEENIEKDIVNVKGKAYGLELVLKKAEGKIRYSIAYTYSRTFIRSPGTFTEEIINSGKWFPSNFDKPNDLVITFNYLFSRRFSFSSSYTLSTGRPITYPVATYQMFNDVLIHYSDRNRYRIPDYSRLDLSLNVRGNLRSHKLAQPNLTFSVYNLLGKQNVYSIYFRKEGEIYKGYKLSVFARAIPSVTFNFDF